MKTRRRNKGGGNCGSQGCPQEPVLVPVPSPVQKPVPSPVPVQKPINQDVYIAGLITKVKKGNKLTDTELEDYNAYLQKKAINDEKLKAEKIAKALLYPTKAEQAAREQAAKEQAAKEQAAKEQAANNQIANYNSRNPIIANKTIKRAFTPKKGGNSKKTHKRKPRRQSK